MQTTDGETIVGDGEWQFRVDPLWTNLPRREGLKEVVGMTCDSQDRVYLFCRGPKPLTVWTADGQFIREICRDLCVRAHGITIAPDDTLWLTDDLGHAVYHCTAEGETLHTLGLPGEPANTGAIDFDHRRITHGGGPFRLPTNVACCPDGTIVVSDGYGNARVHRFAADGMLLASWGEPGDGPEQFKVPHGIAVDSQGRIYVADRENSRVQRFTPRGEFIDIFGATHRPCDVWIDPQDRVYIVELGWRFGLFPWQTAPSDSLGGGVSIWSASGERLARWGSSENPTAPGDFYAAHDIWVDRRGSIFVSEVCYTASGQVGFTSDDCHTLQKFVRV